MLTNSQILHLKWRNILTCRFWDSTPENGWCRIKSDLFASVTSWDPITSQVRTQEDTWAKVQPRAWFQELGLSAKWPANDANALQRQGDSKFVFTYPILGQLPVFNKSVRDIFGVSAWTRGQRGQSLVKSRSGCGAVGGRKIPLQTIPEVCGDGDNHCKEA